MIYAIFVFCIERFVDLINIRYVFSEQIEIKQMREMILNERNEDLESKSKGTATRAVLINELINNKF
jgi:hypothetical protein